MRTIGAGIVVAFWVVGCGGPGATPVDASGEDAAGTDASGADAGSDAGSDAARPDAFVPADAAFDACVAETDAELCTAASAACGMLSVTDRCARARTPSCGTCPGAQTCGARAMPHVCGYEHWDVVDVDTHDDAGQALSLAGAGTELWVAYRASPGAGSALRVAHFAAGAWTTEVLDSGLLVAVDTAIAIDAGGTPHVAVPGPVRGGMASYAELFVRGTGTWTRTPTVSGSGTFVGLALDASGLAHVCAYDPPGSGFGGFLVHVSEDSPGVFTSRTIDGSVSMSTSRVGEHCSIAIDPSGTLHAGYYDSNFGRLRYASRTGTAAWVPTSVDAPSGDYAGDYAFMRLAPDQSPVIVYRALTIGTPEIRRARRSGGTWSHDLVQGGTGVIANYPSIAFDSTGAAHVTYFDSTAPGTLYYAHDTGSAWVREVIDVVGTGSARESAIAVGPGDVIDVVYHEATGHRLRHARHIP